MSVSELPAARQESRSDAANELSLARFLFRPVDISFLVFFRVAFGATMLWHVWRYLSSGAVKYYYVIPPFHFTYYGFEWVRPWPGPGMYVHFFAMGALALGITLGFYYRASAVLFCLGFTYTFLLEKALYQNHYYLICLISFLMVFLPAHRACSLDVVRRPELHAYRVPAWTLWLLRAQIGIPYFYGGLAKLNADWLRGEPMRMGLGDRVHYPFVGEYFTEEWMVWIFSYGGLLIDLLIVPALLWRRTRVIAYAIAVLFHLINAAMFHIGIFPWFMILATLVFFSPDWPRKLLLQRRLRAVPPPSGGQLTLANRITLGCLGVYLALQLFVPLRHYLYPGDVSWTEEGHNFSWHMMLRGKLSAIRLYATDPKTGRTDDVELQRYLTVRQMEKLGKEPDMLVEFGHFVADDLRRRGRGDVEIHALTLVSLNGRKPQLLIDPRVDLAAEPRTWTGHPWILPLKEPLREEPWTVPVTEWERLFFGSQVRDPRQIPVGSDDSAET